MPSPVEALRDVDKVVLLCMDRAVLFVELRQPDLRRVCSSEEVFQALVRRHTMASVLVQRSPSLQRFWPGSVSMAGLEWCSVAALSRPRSWTWPEVVAADGPVCAFSLAVALEKSFRRRSQSFQHLPVVSMAILGRVDARRPRVISLLRGSRSTSKSRQCPGGLRSLENVWTWSRGRESINVTMTSLTSTGFGLSGT